MRQLTLSALSILTFFAAAATNACTASGEDSESTMSLGQAVKKRSGFVTIDAPNSRATIASAINNDGLIVGRYNANQGPGAGPIRAFKLHPDGTFETVAVPGSTVTIFRGINDLGDVTGTHQPAGGNLRRGFVLHPDGTRDDYQVPGARVTFAFDVNNNGLVVGQYTLPNGRQGGWMAEGGVVTDISAPGAFNSYATGVNDQGVIVGIMEESAGGLNHGWIREHGVTTIVDVPSSPERGQVTDTNLDIILNDGTMGGIYGTTDGRRHGFVMKKNGCVTTFDLPIGVAEQVVRGMNKQGDIVGRYVGADGKEHGYVWYGASQGVNCGASDAEPILAGQ